MEKEKSTKRKEVMISILAVLILMVAVFGISYAVWQQTSLGTKENSISTGYVSFSYTESNTNIISIHNATPISDDAGKKLVGNQNSFEFSVSAKYAGLPSIRYEVYTEPIKTTLDGRFLKVYLTNQNDVPVSGYDVTIPTYDSLEASSTGSGKKLYEGTLTESGKVEKLRLRIWVSSAFDMPANKSYQFSFKVHVKGMA